MIPMPDMSDLVPDMSDLELSVYDGLSDAQYIAHKTATDAGWYTNPQTGEKIERNFGELIALMHSELSEALEADRKKFDG